jgi:putative transposase
LTNSATIRPAIGQIIKQTKTVCVGYTATESLGTVFEMFRQMCNDAIEIAIREKPKNRFRLIERAYPCLKEYGLHTHYILYKNKRRKSTPFVKKAFLKLDNQSYQLNHMMLRIPTTPRQFIFLTLRASDYHLSFIDNQSLKRGSITVTDHSVSVAFSREVESSEPLGYIGLDVNERNVTISATDGVARRFDELGEVVEIKERYKEIRAKISKRIRGDNRISRSLLSKYGKRERNRTTQRINRVTRQIVDYARERRLGIKMENLTHITRLFRKGNGLGTLLRGRMNNWVFGETQRQVEFKAKWDGIPVHFVNPKGTSSHCLCGSCVVRLADRKLFCQKCGITWDRDDLASKNIMACVVPQARPSKGSGEGERDGEGSTPLSGWREVGLGGDKPKSQQNQTKRSRMP